MAIEAARPRALVTGAAHGIGAEVARLLAEAGHAVIVADRDGTVARAHADALVAEGHDAEAIALDTADPDSVAVLVDALGFRPLSVLVTTAATCANRPETAAAADLERAREVMSTQLFGLWRLVQAVLPALARSGSARIVNVGREPGAPGDPGLGLPAGPASAGHAVSQAALHALTGMLAAELRSAGVLVNAVDPGLAETADGARRVVAAALLPADGPTGTFTRDGRRLPR
jgi:NAD(P)-dependent dehydrogenase (short-subunit alcohol dehydrogenase family)